MTTQTYLRTLRKGWWIILLVAVLGALAGGLVTARATKLYASTLTFFVSTPVTSGGGSSFADDQFAQHRANSYARLLSSDQLGDRVQSDTSLDLSAGAIASTITGAADINTVLLTATITDSSAQRSLVIARSVAKVFPQMVTSIEPTNSSISLRVVSGPNLNPKPVSPKLQVNLIVGIAAGLIVGLALAFLRTVLDTTFRSADVVTEVTGLATLAVFDRDAAVRRQPLVTGDAERSLRAETFRQLRTNLNFVNVDHVVQTIVVTSSIAEEGKSTTSANLALINAEAGRRVLLVEADLRKPTISELFGLEGGLGLTNVLAGQLKIDDVLQSSGIDRLTILPAGPVPPNPSEMLGSSAMDHLLAALCSRFDLVILDTPPLLPVTDAAVIAALADGVVLVIRYGKTTRAQVAQSLQDLRRVDSHVLGAVLTMRPQRSSGRQSYRYYEASTASRARLELGVPSRSMESGATQATGATPPSSRLRDADGFASAAERAAAAPQSPSVHVPAGGSGGNPPGGWVPGPPGHADSGEFPEEWLAVPSGSPTQARGETSRSDGERPSAGTGSGGGSRASAQGGGSGGPGARPGNGGGAAPGNRPTGSKGGSTPNSGRQGRPGRSRNR